MSLIDIDRALRALDGNDELLKDLASLFVDDAPILLCQLRSALDDSDRHQARAAIHSLRGLVSTFYAIESVELAQRLEHLAIEGDLEEFQSGQWKLLEESINAVADDFRSRGWVNRM